MNILIYIALFSAAGIAFLFSKGVSFARVLPKEDFERRLNETKPVFHDINARIIIPFAVFLHDSFSPKIYKEFEIVISKFRINVLRVERLLLQLANYIRGKRAIAILTGIS
jgi:hypothetical protein